MHCKFSADFSEQLTVEFHEQVACLDILCIPQGAPAVGFIKLSGVIYMKKPLHISPGKRLTG
jgi:hypothetical protein